MRKLLLASVIAFASAPQASSHDLVGTWKLVAFQTILDNEPPKELYGERPKGILVLTKEGRMVAILTAQSRQAGMADAERANLHKSMIAYSGTYRVQGNEFVTAVDVSWNESWNGSEQKRFWRIDNNQLFIESAPGPSPGHAGRTSFGRLVWVRE